MTQENIDRLKQISRERYRLSTDYNKQIGVLNREERKLQNACDHLNPDGTSAVDNTGMFMNVCTICHANDM